MIDIEQMWCWCSHSYQDHLDMFYCASDDCPCDSFINAGAIEKYGAKIFVGDQLLELKEYLK